MRGEQMGTQSTVSERITAEVTAWPGVHAEYGTRGEFAFKLGAREVRHLHGDNVAHFGFPKHVWRELFEQQRIDFGKAATAGVEPFIGAMV